jgi:hypothetical protein
VTNWVVLAVTLTAELAIVKAGHTLFGEPERILDTHHDRRLLARSNLEADKIIPHLASLFASMNTFRAANPVSEADALLAIGYEPTVQGLTDAYGDYVRLDRLPKTIGRAAVALAVALVLSGLFLPFVTANFIAAHHDALPDWTQMVATILLTVSGTLAAVAATAYYRNRQVLTRLLETYG